ncbi:acetamidase/formamidase family protein [Pseudonocardia phyllosphaerae]|uniref:acetamidase/formamidase family protein n=1 Tax=Pseudonocardia phyllosphaerae TaxID=3390502 RepID=UPI00397A5B3A
MSDPIMSRLRDGLGRRQFLLAAAAASAATGASGCGTTVAPVADVTPLPDGPLQPRAGDIPGDHYLESTPEAVRWGYVPAIGAEPVLTIRSGQTVTIDAVSHEGILEDQGRDPVAYFGRHGVARDEVLADAVAIARDYRRTPRDFDTDGPHVITGPVFVEGARPGDVLKVETLSVVPRVPYGVVSSRHGKGALARAANGGPPAGITIDEIMPPVGTDGRATKDPQRYGNVSVFTEVRPGQDGAPQAVMPFGNGQQAAFPLRPFMGTMGVAHARAGAENAPELNSVPPTLGGGNIDIRLLGPDSAFYLPVRSEGALFYVGDPHLAMGDGEVALTALEGSLRGTFRLTVCRKGEGTAPSPAFSYPFGETPSSWIPIGLSDPDGAAHGQNTDLDVAMRRAVVNALDFLEADRGMDRPTAYAYLSATADFVVSQVVDKTVGVHGVISKAHFGAR